MKYHTALIITTLAGCHVSQYEVNCVSISDVYTSILKASKQSVTGWEPIAKEVTNFDFSNVEGSVNRIITDVFAKVEKDNDAWWTIGGEIHDEWIEEYLTNTQKESWEKNTELLFTLQDDLMDNLEHNLKDTVSFIKDFSGEVVETGLENFQNYLEAFVNIIDRWQWDGTTSFEENIRMALNEIFQLIKENIENWLDFGSDFSTRLANKLVNDVHELAVDSSKFWKQQEIVILELADNVKEYAPEILVSVGVDAGIDYLTDDDLPKSTMDIINNIGDGFKEILVYLLEQGARLLTGQPIDYVATQKLKLQLKKTYQDTKKTIETKFTEIILDLQSHGITDALKDSVPAPIVKSVVSNFQKVSEELLKILYSICNGRFNEKASLIKVKTTLYNALKSLVNVIKQYFGSLLIDMGTDAVANWADNFVPKPIVNAIGDEVKDSAKHLLSQVKLIGRERTEQEEKLVKLQTKLYDVTNDKTAKEFDGKVEKAFNNKHLVAARNRRRAIGEDDLYYDNYNNFRSLCIREWSMYVARLHFSINTQKDIIQALSNKQANIGWRVYYKYNQEEYYRNWLKIY